MQSSLTRLVLVAVLALGVCGAPAFAQKYELHPYAGGQWMGKYDVLDFKNPAIFGLKGGAFLSDNFMLEGNGGYINQFNFRNYTYRSHAFLYEVAGSYNFFRARAGRVYPYVTFGVGGLTVDNESFANSNDQNSAVYSIPLKEPVFEGGPIPRTLRAFIVQDGDTFLNFSYGGGVKASRLWGPLGLRADLRGRTMPNFFGTGVHSMEATGGLLFSWGER
jgi:hypothetical protein